VKKQHDASKGDITMKDLALLIIRLVPGGLMAGHGAQKLFGAFGGNGLEGTAGWLESMGLEPGKPWAAAAGMGEFGGGLLSATGLLHPLGPIGVIATMTVATAKAHWGKPIWNTEGGAELPVLNIAFATALLASGPGKYSLDKAFGLSLPRWVVLLVAFMSAMAVLMAIRAEAPEAGMDEADTDEDEEWALDESEGDDEEMEYESEIEVEYSRGGS
jgi:putative oxidoreductase